MAFALYYQENGSFPSASIVTTTAPAAGNAWWSVGLFTTPSIPAGVASITVDGTQNSNAGPVLITYTFAATGIKAATIDTKVLQEQGTVSSTAIDWTCVPANTTVTDKVALKYFKC
ncbi:MAG: pilin [Gallionellaceae bacterium]